MRPLVENDIVNGVLRDTQSTHGLSAQASAARLILMLREQFFPDFENNEILNERMSELKEYIFSYIDSVIDDTEPPEENIDITYIKGIIEFIDYVLSKTMPPFNDPEKQKSVLEEIKQLVQLGSDHWTKNSVFDPLTSQEMIIDASLGETLNLVCLASLGDDVDGYKNLITPEYYEDEKRFRVLSLFNCLVGLHSSGICTGGRQHELLFLLNRVYPKKQADGSYKTIQLIEDLKSFLHENMQSYLSKALKEKYRDDESRLFILARDWLLCMTDPNMSISPEHCEWLTSQVEALKQFLHSQCEIYGLKSTAIDHEIQEICDFIISFPVPDGIGEYIPVFREVLLIKANNNNKEISQSRNAALFSMQDLIKNADSYKACLQYLQLFLQAESYYQRINKYARLTLFIGHVEASFRDAIISLNDALIMIFSKLKNQIPLSDEEKNYFENIREQFTEKENKFLKETNTDFVTNFFSMIEGEGGNWHELYNKLAIENDRSSLLLTDNMINEFLNRVTPEGIVDITPYEVNRILIHAILTFDDAGEWSDTFKYALMEITKWLLATNDDVSRETKVFRASYHRPILVNLNLRLLTTPLEFFDEYWAIDEFCVEDESFVINDFFPTMIENYFDNQESDVETNEMLSQLNRLFEILNRNQLPIIIDGLSLRILLYLPKEQAKFFWNYFKNNLSSLINHEADVVWLLTAEPLKSDHFNDIYNVIVSSISRWISEGDVIGMLWGHKFITAAQQNHLWELIKSHLPENFENKFARYLGILENSQFNENQKDGKRREHFTESQRDDIWNAIENRLSRVLHDGHYLAALVEFFQDNPERLNRILLAAQQKLPLLVSSFNIFRRVYVCLLENNNSNCESFLTAIKKHLSSIPFGEDDLKDIFNTDTYPEHVRDIVWHAVKFRLAKINNGNVEIYLSLLTYKNFKEEYFLDIWDNIKSNIGNISNAEDLLKLFTCKHISHEKKCEIFTSHQDLILRLLSNRPSEFTRFLQHYIHIDSNDIFSVLPQNVESYSPTLYANYIPDSPVVTAIKILCIQKYEISYSDIIDVLTKFSDSNRYVELMQAPGEAQYDIDVDANAFNVLGCMFREEFAEFINFHKQPAFKRARIG